MDDIKVGTTVRIVTRDSQTFGEVERIKGDDYTVRVTVCPDGYYQVGGLLLLQSWQILAIR